MKQSERFYKTSFRLIIVKNGGGVVVVVICEFMSGLILWEPDSSLSTS